MYAKILLGAYYGYIHSHISYTVLCWGRSAHASKVFAVQRRCVRVIAGRRYTECCKGAFVSLGILTLPSIYILTFLIHVKNHLNDYTHNSDLKYNTRGRDNLSIKYSRTSRARDGQNHFGIKYFNMLPDQIKILNLKQFKKKLKSFLKIKAIYSESEYFLCNFGELV